MKKRDDTRASCPACNLLPLEFQSNGRPPSLADIDLATIDHATLHSFASECDFCRLIADLHQQWTLNKCQEGIEYVGVPYGSISGKVDWKVRHATDSELVLAVDFGKRQHGMQLPGCGFQIRQC